MPHADPAAYREYQRLYRQRTRAKRNADRPDYDRARHANRRARELGIEGRITVQDVRVVLAAGHCFYCDSTERLTLDHKVPLARGGANSPENLVCSCHRCNMRKARRLEPGTWAEYYDACVACGKTDSRHVSRGWCNRCYSAFRHTHGCAPQTEDRAAVRALD